MELLEPSRTTTRCPYKGIAQYFSLRFQERYEEDMVWTYPEPFHDGEPIRGLLCFVEDRVELKVDGSAPP